jgi:hypothetical protein
LVLDITKPIEKIELEMPRPRRMSQLDTQMNQRGLFKELKSQRNLDDLMKEKGLEQPEIVLEDTTNTHLPGASNEKTTHENLAV